jgi:RimJ/RimL family protein N-acetyltransferase
MRLCIDRWLAEYRNKTFVRFAILGKKSGKAVGTVEMFARAKEDEHDNKVGVLRIDLLPAYEQKQYLAEILKIADDRFYEAFHVDQIITKAVPEALERRAALKASGYIPLESNKIPYAHYFFRINQDSPMR